MAPSKKKNRTGRRRQRKSASANDRTELAPQTDGRSVLTTQHLRAIWQAHPIRPKSIIFAFAIVSAIAFVFALAAAKGLLPQFIVQVANENMAPRTAIVLAAACLWVLSGVIAVRGPFAERSGWVYRTFGTALPIFALGAWGLLCGISVGALAAAIVVGTPVAPYLPAVASRLGLLAFGLMVFLSITVTIADAPGYAGQRFRSVTRCFAAVMFLVMTGWFIVGGLYVGKQ